jgi:hypothetical protein
MRIYQLKTAKEFADYFKDSNLTTEQLMQMYAEDVAKRFAAECVNETLGNKMEVSNALHSSIENRYNSIIWEQHNVEKETIEPHNFCETPEEQCTMNYCDENGCMNRKREATEDSILIKTPKQETLEEVRKVERSDLYNKIYSIVKQIPREDVETDAMDASSCAYDIEQLFYKRQQERMYSEKEVLQLLLRLQQTESYDNLYSWFEQFKKK